MTSLADKAILLGANNRPPVLEKDMYDSWKSIMELYMLNRQHGRMILESVENGPLLWPTVEENRVTRPKKYSELSKLDEDKEGKVVDPSHYRAFADADHAGCQDTRRIRKLNTSPYKMLCSNSMDEIPTYGLWPWIKIPMNCNNKNAIALCCNNVQHSRSKHIDIKYHFIKEQVENRVIELYFVNTEYQLADLFTKALGRDRIEFLINKLGMRSFTPETLKQLTDEVDE
uniref:Retrotransposon protein, putative, unclassified n=1 Tax=Tanacetum cinerariifolium TaxID=118510 RepID=A0A699H9R9_TANCI|nr:retrotransposon protein, putative, unclassified [Tanacetum cinerariifolium]